MLRYAIAVFVISITSLLPVLFLDLPGRYFHARQNSLDTFPPIVLTPNVAEEEINRWQELAIREKQKEVQGSPKKWTTFHNVYQLGNRRDSPGGQQNAYIGLNDGGNVFLFSAVAMNTTVSKHWDSIVVNAWETRKLVQEHSTCCFMYKDKTQQVNVMKKISFKQFLGHDPNTVQGRQYVCKNPLRGKRGDVPKGVTVVKANQKCPVEVRYYLKPVLPERPRPNSFVVCAKVVFGKVKANSLIEWLEYQKYFGVTKVIVYLSYDTNESAKRVLEHYSEDGFVDVIPVGKLPKLGQVRDWAAKNNFVNVAQDTAVILFDFQARCHGYTFGAVIDPDEFVLIKDGSKTFVEFMNNIMKTGDLSQMAYAKITPEFHITEWDIGRRKKSIPMMLTTYNYHTPPLPMSRKNFYVTSRVVHGSIATHSVTPKPGYTSVAVDPKGAVLRHYRNCEGKFQNESYTKCIEGKDRILDKEITRIASAIYPHVENVRKLLDIDYPSS